MVKYVVSSIAPIAPRALRQKRFPVKEMTSRTRVKICGLTRQEDADLAVRCGADAIGLVFFPPSPRAIEVDAAVPIAARAPAFTDVVAVFVDPDPALVSAVVAKVNPDYLQFHGDETEDACMAYGRPYIKAIRVRPEIDLGRTVARYPSARAVLLDTFREGVYGGTGAAFDWSFVAECGERPVILAGGLNAETIETAIDRVAPYGVDISSGVESAPGVKCPDKIRQFMGRVHQLTAERY